MIAKLIRAAWIAGLLVLSACSHAPIAAPSSCVADPDLHARRSEELQSIERADQADRAGTYDSVDWTRVLPRDRQRLKRVAEIFAEGCFKEARDYAAAAMVFQHGETADHVYQTFIWSRRAVELGDSARKRLMAMGLDRYLVRTGFKQLFATQGGKDPGSPCWCLESVESAFPDSKRVEYVQATLAEAMKWIASLNSGDAKACPSPRICERPLKPTPAGTFP